LQYAEFSNNDHVDVSEKESTIHTEESFAVGNVGKSDYIVVKMPGKRHFLLPN
jgi:hypothetical protein